MRSRCLSVVLGPPWSARCSVAGALPARADDVTTLSGTTYHEAHAVRVDPDGVTWEHSTGMVKVDFTDLPEPVRRAYHYDAGKAKVYQEAQAKAQAEYAARSQQNQHDAEARRVQRFQGQRGGKQAGGVRAAAPRRRRRRPCSR